ncbi:hypothetical protein HMPREF3213_03362 [Heyndrickxia coagulans]|uniref:Uncharacterized protein n=1 Tax=Heyndrickxia coagulans TaxID=1398 RepID=A0A133KC77_HEYCO|nr:hypothetical protein HMPREF3213_03362 [Heyndrickxia coagulans]
MEIAIIETLKAKMALLSLDWYNLCSSPVFQSAALARLSL